MSFDPVTAITDVVSKVIDRAWPDPVQAAAAKLQLLALQQSGDLAQVGVDLAEANSKSLFVSGWRPAIGWACVVACAWNWVGLDVFKFIMAAIGHAVNVGAADVSTMMPILMGLLGLGGLRTIEKINGVAAQ